jgi:hypothetical protein
MKRALPFLQQQLEKTCDFKFIAIDVSAKQLLPKAEATPGKKTTSKSFSTDVLLCPPELSARACENPRSCLSEVCCYITSELHLTVKMNSRGIRIKLHVEF